MKKVLLFITIVIAALSTISSWGAKYEQNTFTPIQLSFWYGVPNWPQVNYIDGLRLGVPYASTTLGTNEKLNGLEFGIISQSKEVNGLQFSIINIMTQHIYGMQAGFFSMGQYLKAFQLNAYNFCAQSDVMQMGIGNVGGYDVNGLQLGLINALGENSTGAQIGLVDYCDKVEGFQIGLLNINSDSNSDLLQIGLFNYCDNGFIPFFPLFNFSTIESREDRYPRALDYLTTE